MQFEDLGAAWMLFKNQIGQEPSFWLVLTVAGLPLNFYIETIKWNGLIRKITPLSLAQASRAVFSGLTMAMLTPNRVGEIVSRAFVLPPDKRAEGIALSGVNSLAQMLITQTLGMAGMALIYMYLPEHNPFKNTLSLWVILISGVLCILLAFGFFNLSWLSSLLKWFRLDKKLSAITIAIQGLDLKAKWKLLALSLAKYLTFCLQFYFLIHYFGVDLNLVLGLSCIMTIFLLLNFLPVITIGEAGIRGSISLLVFGAFSDAEMGILVGSLALWILNVAFPAIIGSFLLRKIKF